MATLIFEHSNLSGADRLGSTLRDHGHHLDIRRLHEGDAVPGDLDGVDAIVSCGGGHSANDDSLPWLQPQMELLRAAHERQVPMLGLCLGCQIIGRALGGTVGPCAGGPELGWFDVTLTPQGCEDPLFRGIAWTSTQPQWHCDEVKELPSGGRVLATSERCTAQAWALGIGTYGIQYHPEITADRMEQWADDEPDALRGVGTTREDLAAQTEANFPACARLADRLFDSIALLLMPVDRRYQGLVKDLHH